jgi:hypothetical protein
LSAVLLDNINGALGGATLAAAITATDFEGRLLGQNVSARAPLRTVWLTTGNNITFKGDLGRRMVPIDLDARLEHPEDRTGFRHSDLLEWVRKNRAELLVAALTILRAFHVAGRPAHGGPRKGSFEDWDDLVRSGCIWAGIGDPLVGTERIRREDDSDIATLRIALAAWYEAFGTTPETAAEAVNHALARAEDDSHRDTLLRDALLGLTQRNRLDGRSLGYALRRVRGRIVNAIDSQPWSFEIAREEHGTARWRVVMSLEPGGMGAMEGMTRPSASANDASGSARSPRANYEVSPPSPPSPPAEASQEGVENGSEPVTALESENLPPGPLADLVARVVVHRDGERDVAL